MRIIVLPVGRCRFLEQNESGLRFWRNTIWRFIIDPPYDYVVYDQVKTAWSDWQAGSGRITQWRARVRALRLVSSSASAFDSDNLSLDHNQWGLILPIPIPIPSSSWLRLLLRFSIFTINSLMIQTTTPTLTPLLVKPSLKIDAGCVWSKKHDIIETCEMSVKTGERGTDNIFLAILRIVFLVHLMHISVSKCIYPNWISLSYVKQTNETASTVVHVQSYSIKNKKPLIPLFLTSQGTLKEYVSNHHDG